MTDPQVWIPLLSLGGAFALWVTRLLWRAGRFAARFAGDYYGSPARPGVPRRPGVMERLEQQGHQLDTVLSRLEPLSDMAEQVARVDAQTRDLTRRVAALERGEPPPRVELFRK